tara:strand:- start:26 stop:505 length:480 start_codon:yes stop_codon:yes gene_type:complete
MSTRACYTFVEPYGIGFPSNGGGQHHVYKHHDGYPYAGQLDANGLFECGGLVFIENAKQFAWELPRFEADDFASAFVVANKPRGGGGVRLINTPEPWDFSCDTAYWYKVTQSRADSSDVHVEVYHVDWWDRNDRRNQLVSKGMLLDLLEEERKKVKISA